MTEDNQEQEENVRLLAEEDALIAAIDREGRAAIQSLRASTVAPLVQLGLLGALVYAHWERGSLVTAVIACLTLVTTVATAIQIGANRRHDKALAQLRTAYVAVSYAHSAALLYLGERHGVADEMIAGISSAKDVRALGVKLAQRAKELSWDQRTQPEEESK